MRNPLISARDGFLKRNPEARREISGRDWGVIRAGNGGPALVLIPGTLGRADIFWRQIGALQGQARILALSYPATGGIADWAEDVVELVRQEGMEGACLLGSSLGGYLAQFTAARFPRVFTALVAANTLPSVAGLDRIPPYSNDLQTTPIEILRNGFAAGIRLWQTPDNPYADLAGLLLAEVEGRIPEPELRTRLQALKTAPALPAQTLPENRTFTVESDDDHLIPPEIRAAVRTALTPGRAYVFGQASHFPYVTHPWEYTDMLKEVLGLSAPSSRWSKGAEARL